MDIKLLNSIGNIVSSWRAFKLCGDAFVKCVPVDSREHAVLEAPFTVAGWKLSVGR